MTTVRSSLGVAAQLPVHVLDSLAQVFDSAVHYGYFIIFDRALKGPARLPGYDDAVIAREPKLRRKIRAGIRPVPGVRGRRPRHCSCWRRRKLLEPGGKISVSLKMSIASGERASASKSPFSQSTLRQARFPRCISGILLRQGIDASPAGVRVRPYNFPCIGLHVVP